MKTLLVYYSLEGTTHTVAEKIASSLGCDILRLVPVKEIPTSSMAKKIMTGGMYASIGYKAKLKPYTLNPSDYDTIIIGTPIWAGKSTPAVNKFISENGIKEKTKAVFTLSGSENASGCISLLKKKLPNVTVSASMFGSKPLSDKNDEIIAKFVEDIKSL